MKVSRVVFDTNVLISALLSQRGTARQALDFIRRDGCLVFSDPTFHELATRLNRAKFDTYVSKGLRTNYLHALVDISEWVSIQGGAYGCRDTDDDKFLETALVGEVDALVSGDKDLLVMRRVNDIPILSVADCLVEML